jgi:uncharacterized Zn-binding protein involved in type VI secretion
MPATVRLGDSGTGHGCWPPRANVAGSPDVFINDRAAHRVGDGWAAHTCPAIPETHAGSLAAGSGTVFVNGRALGRIGDPVSCGSAAATGSPDVFAN